MQQSLPVVIIGTGLAGYQTAKNFRALDTNTPLILITADQGHFYSKPQLSTSLSQSKVPDSLILKTYEQMQIGLNATIKTNITVKKIEPASRKIYLSSGEIIDYRDLVFAAGAQCITLPVFKECASSVFQLNDWNGYSRLHENLMKESVQHVLIIGSGLVGSELSNDMVALGKQVTMISLDEWLMQKLLPKPIAQTMEQAFAKHGIDCLFETTINHISPIENEQLRVALKGKHNEVIETDLIVSAVGFKPNIDLFKATDVTIKHGICVDDQCRSSDPHIYALGDCAQFGSIWRPYIAPIMHASKVVARALVGDHDAKLVFPRMPIVAKTPLCRVIADLPELYDADSVEVIQQQIDANTTLFFDEQKRLRGYVLCAQALARRPELQKQLA